MKINAQRLLADLETLAAYREPDTPGWTRRFPSPAYVQARAWLRARMAEAGLETRIDAAANLFGRAPGATARELWIGSHTDSVFGGGRLDGALGTLAALEVARTLRESAARLAHTLVVCDYLAEEANDFGVSCVGSRALNGTFKREHLARAAAGQTLAQAVRDMGGDPDHIASASVVARPPAACLELHIEQGPALIERSAGLAAVTGIVAIRRGVFEVRGQPDHAGTTPMHVRQDALATAARAVLALRERCDAEPAAVGTVGRLEVEPNFANVVPGLARVTAEVRSLDVAVIARIWRAWLDDVAAADAQFRTRTAQLSETNAAAARPPEWLLQTVTDACMRLDPCALQLPSGAGHDTQHLALVAPAAMIFVPSIGGRSHCPEEDTSPEHLELGAQALLEAVRALDNKQP